MEVIKGDIWNVYAKGEVIVIPTNGFVKNDGEAVMGAGLALQCKRIYPKMPAMLGQMLIKHGNNVFLFTHAIPKGSFYTFPVKHNWWEKADVKLIEKSCDQLVEEYLHSVVGPVYLPMVGCGNGQLSWGVVEKILDAKLDPTAFKVVDLKGER